MSAVTAETVLTLLCCHTAALTCVGPPKPVALPEGELFYGTCLVSHLKTILLGMLGTACFPVPSRHAGRYGKTTSS